MWFRTPTPLEMMVPLQILCCFALFVAPPTLGDGGDRHVAKSKSARELAELVERSESVGFSGAMLAAKGGKVLVAMGVGMADADAGVPNTAETRLEIASATKQFTGAAICALAQDKKIDLDASIAEYLPDVPESCAAITVRQLVQHTSGIPGTNSAGGGDDLRAVIPIFLQGGPRHEPGTHWEYWNQGYALLAGIIERESGDSYADYCKSRLFKPAKMKDSGFTGDDAPRGAVVAVGRSERGDRGAFDHPYGMYGYQYRGMGGAVTTVWDLWRWDRALHGKKVLNAKSKKELFAPGLEDYALGWYVKEVNDRLAQYHAGGVRGFACKVTRFPDEDAALFVLCNDDEAPAHQLSALFERALFGESYVAPPYPLGDDLQRQVVGTFTDAGGGRLEVTADGLVTKALIHWPAGQVTYGYLGRKEADDDALVYYAWTSADPVGVTVKDGRITKLGISRGSYER